MNDTPQLQQTCPECDGKGQIVAQWTPSGKRYCPACEGTCVVPTDFGEAVLSFIRKHLEVETKVRL